MLKDVLKPREKKYIIKYLDSLLGIKKAAESFKYFYNIKLRNTYSSKEKFKNYVEKIATLSIKDSVVSYKIENYIWNHQSSYKIIFFYNPNLSTSDKDFSLQEGYSETIYVYVFF